MGLLMQRIAHDIAARAEGGIDVKVRRPAIN